MASRSRRSNYLLESGGAAHPAAKTPGASTSSAAEIAAADAAEALHPPKKEETLFLSAIAYPGNVTELRWVNDGRGYRVFSNIDFTILPGYVSFESDDFTSRRGLIERA